jgi:predicted dehydrogenase
LNIHKVSSQPVLRAAVIGGGVFGRHHAAKYRHISGVDLLAVADPDPRARRQVSERLNVPAVADWRELLGKLDLVSICSPATTHAEITRAFLDSAAHVLVEKPIATSVSDAEHLIALARSRGLVLTVGHQERYVISETGLFEISQSPVVVECVRRGPWTGRGADVSVVLDLMIHDLDLVHALVPGEISTVQAAGQFVYGPSHDEVSADLTFESGAIVRLVADRAAETRTRSLRLTYRDGAEISVDFLSRQIVNTTTNRLKLRDSSDPLADSVTGFVDAVRAGATVLVRPEEALRALETALRVEDALMPAIVSRKRQAIRRTA